MAPAYLKGPVATVVRVRHVSCEGKVAYRSAFLAYAVAQRSVHTLAHYHCDFCGKWHVGNVLRGGAPAIKARAELVRAG